MLAALALALVAMIAMGALPKQPVAFFAYGANLAGSSMNARAGGYLNATAAALPGYALAFASQDSRPAEFGVATPAESEGCAVQGALYYLTPGQMAALDRQAGVPGFYGRRGVGVALPDGSIVDAQAYFLSGATHAAAPSGPYYLSVKAGMEEWGYGQSALDAAVAGAAAGQKPAAR